MSRAVYINEFDCHYPYLDTRACVWAFINGNGGITDNEVINGLLSKSAVKLFSAMMIEQNTTVCSLPPVIVTYTYISGPSGLDILLIALMISYTLVNKASAGSVGSLAILLRGKCLMKKRFIDDMRVILVLSAIDDAADCERFRY